MKVCVCDMTSNVHLLLLMLMLLLLLLLLCPEGCEKCVRVLRFDNLVTLRLLLCDPRRHLCGDIQHMEKQVAELRRQLDSS